MNVFQKAGTINVFLDESDFENTNDRFVSSLIELISLSENKEIRYKLKNIVDIPLDKLGILLSFSQNLRKKNATISMQVNEKLETALSELGVGDLLDSIDRE
ncbi:MAG: hypothetical protein H7A25_10710 [Leptospiraceae bacterium]|nr:hypothetical protein [Leptospiraceae bacterium]MCP5500365.1 hypothetical protein [Leptospiraceae bacterium]